VQFEFAQVEESSGNEEKTPKPGSKSIQKTPASPSNVHRYFCWQLFTQALDFFITSARNFHDEEHRDEDAEREDPVGRNRQKRQRCRTL
jgi:hypothetical protein